MIRDGLLDNLADQDEVDFQAITPCRHEQATRSAILDFQMCR